MMFSIMVLSVLFVCTGPVLTTTINYYSTTKPISPNPTFRTWKYIAMAFMTQYKSPNRRISYETPQFNQF
ncbi:mfs transporter [Lasius niger]|uniref:Mfs transporter n=1 Tax=Lasius niger TaxID=67767 RepID=A0A0J7N527_LASNI|nr:mfs transporter [Lasius niger]KMQ89516.1 mfs transporter [Lasius niger]